LDGQTFQVLSRKTWQSHQLVWLGSDSLYDTLNCVVIPLNESRAPFRAFFSIWWKLNQQRSLLLMRTEDDEDKYQVMTVCFSRKCPVDSRHVVFGTNVFACLDVENARLKIYSNDTFETLCVLDAIIANSFEISANRFITLYSDTETAVFDAETLEIVATFPALKRLLFSPTENPRMVKFAAKLS
jgi:hypothetical protein